LEDVRAVSRPEHPSISALGAVLLSALALGLGFALLLLFAAARSLSGEALPEAWSAVAADPVNLAAAQAMGFAVTIAVGLRASTGDASIPTAPALALDPRSPALLAVAGILGVALQFPLSELANCIHELRPLSIDEQLARRELMTPTTIGAGLSIVFSAVLVAPATEELLFRGLLLRGLRNHHGTAVAVIVSSLLFGVVHLEVGSFLYASAAGLMLAALALRTGSTFVGMMAHMGVNATPLLLPERLLPIDGFNTVSAEVTHLHPPLLFLACGATVALFFVILRLSRRPEPHGDSS
jgi:membrane protease YdiL (CAAX protease family)